MKPWIIAGAVIVGLLVAFTAFISFGAYDFAADKPHTALTTSIVEYARDRAVTMRARDIKVPNLASHEMIHDGASHYVEMCSGCHLAPGMESTEMRDGLNPRPPELAREEPLPPREQFWVVKHGIKMTGMPAWGLTHSDREIWTIVAFLQKLPTLSADQYRELSQGAAETHEHHEHEMQH